LNTYNATTTGNYSLSVKNSYGCEAYSTDSIVIKVNPKPVIENFTVGESGFCKGDSVKFSVTNNQEHYYKWLYDGEIIPENTTNILVARESGNYVLRVSNASSCLAETSPVTVTVYELPDTPNIYAPAKTTICEGDTVKLFVSPVEGLTYLWSGGLNSNTLNTYNATTTGNYSLTVKNASGCEAIAGKSIAVTVNTNPKIESFTYGNTEFCKGATVTFSVTNNDNYSYQWLNNGTPIDKATQNQFIANESGNYKLQILNASGCSVEAPQVEVIANEIPAAFSINEPAKTTICEGDTVNLFVSPIEGVSYLWSGGLNPNKQYTYNATTTGTYTLSVKNSKGCEVLASNQIDVEVNAKPNIEDFSYGETTFCEGGNVRMSVTNNSNYSYQWMEGSTEITNANTYQYTSRRWRRCAPWTAA
jgi:hypothetical protein